MNLSKYKTIIFDCDGVILNSNKIKTNAFYLAALPYGEGAAKELVEYHVLHGGVSRYKKLDHFLSVIVPRHCTEDQSPSRHGFSTVLEKLLDEYAGIVTKELLACEIAEGLVELREENLTSKWLVASGGDQAELRTLFRARGIADYFDSGIFGSPDTKEEIIKRETRKGNIDYPAVFLGDSKYDYEAASSADMDFVYIHGWSEWRPEKSWLDLSGVSSFQSLKGLLNEK